MELFKGAKAVRLRSHHDKYLLADEDEERVYQDRSGSSPAARWTVEIVGDSTSVPIIRLKSCYGRYLTASNEPFLLGVTGRKVHQTLPPRPDSSVEWEPLRNGLQIKLKTRYGRFLRANSGLPPWRNSVTHDIPNRTSTQDWILWDLDVVDIRTPSAIISRQELSPSSSSSLPGSPQHRAEGRTIYYRIGDEDGNVIEGDEEEGDCFTFKGTSVAELTEKLEEMTGIYGMFVCSRNPLNGKLYPLKLQLPPNNTTMRVVVVPDDSRDYKRSIIHYELEATYEGSKLEKMNQWQGLSIGQRILCRMREGQGSTHII